MTIDKNTKIRLGNRNIVKVKKGNVVIWESQSTPPVVEPDYFYVENTYAGTNTISLRDNESSILMGDLQYSKDKETWTTFTPSTTALNISLNQGEKLYIRGSGNRGGARLKISGSQSHIVGGNINTLIKYDDPNNVTLSQNAFSELFEGDGNLTGTSSLTLPSTVLAVNCYMNMFFNCTSLKSAPTLPATTLAANCYMSMFLGCTSLTTAPELPVTNLRKTYASSCYFNMFSGCTSLTSAPALPATTLVSGCYGSMFNGCTSLTSVTIYATTTESDAFNGWLFNVAASGTVTNAGFLELPENSASGIPTGWTEVLPIQSITAANPDTFTLKSYQTEVNCSSTLTITTTLGTTVTKTNSVTLTVGENTGDSTRTLTETIPYGNSSYQVTIVQTANDPKPAQTWNVVSTGTYPFQLNSNDYYESTNKSHDNTYSYATLSYFGYDEIVLECINSGESYYDYGIVSQPDQTLSESISDDGSTGSTVVFHNFKEESSTSPVTLTIPSDGGSHFITIKFIKDTSSSQGNDSLQFKVVEP